MRRIGWQPSLLPLFEVRINVHVVNQPRAAVTKRRFLRRCLVFASAHFPVSASAAAAPTSTTKPRQGMENDDF